MSHIILHSKSFWFVHNPKVGGSSLRTQIGKLDETGRKFFHVSEDHPVLGPIFMGHVPLDAMRTYFAEDFDRIKGYETFAMVRDPMDRFRSAYAQRSKQFTDERMRDQDTARRQAGIEEVLCYLETRPTVFKEDFCHFQPQADYVELDGQRFIKHLYRLEEIEAAMQDISAQIGVTLEPVQKNKSFGISQSTAPELHSDALQSFVEDYYARDYEIYRALSTHPALAGAETV
ncbi:sulfotransferase family 2 domain-containing protein [Celeribacter litoreus]|uniref:sulfotransferase family 2 domain-containing protein n=1 Tax=Celeribacter litoreus TaxID=2876714 RepID=UPI001CCC914A|nr:sulfotransferase family 2 domain-containing protein [Celeribacter litoreus]MCA0044713.1 sulfotransferase family protein [Celeribacter litoreus]